MVSDSNKYWKIATLCSIYPILVVAYHLVPRIGKILALTKKKAGITNFPVSKCEVVCSYESKTGGVKTLTARKMKCTDVTPVLLRSTC